VLDQRLVGRRGKADANDQPEQDDHESGRTEG